MKNQAVMEELTTENSVLENYYAVLGVHRASSHEDLRAAWHSIAAVTHPDRTGDDPVKCEVFIKARRAYHNLSNDKLVKRYLAQLKVLSTQCAACSGSGTKAHARSWNSVSLTACVACGGCGYTLRRN